MTALLAVVLLAAAEAPQAERALVEYRAPRYPPEALASRREREVTCYVSVDATGAVSDLFIDRQEDPEFSAATAEAASHLRFEPAAGPSVISFVYRFALSPRFSFVPGLLALRGSARVEVREAGTRVLLPGASIVAVGLGSGGNTGARGTAVLALPAGEEELLVFAPEHAFRQERVWISPGETAPVAIYLQRIEPDQLSAVVPGERRRDAPVQTELSREELRNVPGTNEDPMRVIELLPGVARAPFTGGQLLVRGARPEDTGAYINGQRIPILYHLLNGPSVLSESALDRLDFLAGGAGVYYGRNLAGIVSVNPRSTVPDGWHGLAAADLKKSSVFLEAPAGERRQFFVAGRVSYPNPADRLFDKNLESNPHPTYGDYQASFRQRLDGGGSVGVLAFGSEDSLSQSQEGRGLSLTTQDQSIGFHRVQLLGSFPLSPSVLFSVTPLFGYDRSIDRSAGTPGLGNAPPQVRDTRTVAGGLRSEVAYKRDPRFEVRGGIDSSIDNVRYRFDQQASQDLEQLGATSSLRELREGVQHTLALGQYVEVSAGVGPLRITPGLRVDAIHWNGHTRTGIDPRLWMRMAAGSGQVFAYAGLYHQAPQPVELDPGAGNPGLDLERALQTGAGIEQRWRSYTVRLEGFYERRNDLVFPASPTATASGTVANPHFLNSGVGRSYGFEVLLRRELGGAMYGWIAYTLSRTEEIPAPGDPWQPGTFDQRHILNLLLAMRISTQIELSTRLRVATGNPDRRVLDAVFDSTAGRFVPVQQALGSQRLPTFTQLDVEVNNIWTADLYRVALYIDLENLLGRTNGEVLVHDYRFQQQDYLPGVPFGAAVGARVTF